MKEKINRKINNIISRIGAVILDTDKRELFMFKVLNIVLGMVSLLMTVVNIITKFNALMISTLAFTVVSFINFGLTHCGKKVIKIARYAFVAEMIALFTFFLISGEPEGFSPFWTCLLPACGFMIFSMAEALIADGIMLLIIIFFCWTPLGRGLLLFDYTDSFLLRFPLMYIGFLSVGILLSMILTHTQNSYHSLSSHDVLTGALNRTGFIEDVKLEEVDSYTVGFMILDLDNFKDVNDTYGHFVGDEVLCYAMRKIEEASSGCAVCRWGGEEFAVFVKNGEDTQILAKSIVKALDSDDFVSKDGIKIHQTISCGAVETKLKGFDRTLIAGVADNCLYEAKEQGRNRVVFKVV